MNTNKNEQQESTGSNLSSVVIENLAAVEKIRFGLLVTCPVSYGYYLDPVTLILDNGTLGATVERECAERLNPKKCPLTQQGFKSFAKSIVMAQLTEEFFTRYSEERTNQYKKTLQPETVPTANFQHEMVVGDRDREIALNKAAMVFLNEFFAGIFLSGLLLTFAGFILVEFLTNAVSSAVDESMYEARDAYDIWDNAKKMADEDIDQAKQACIQQALNNITLTVVEAALTIKGCNQPNSQDSQRVASAEALFELADQHYNQVYDKTWNFYAAWVAEIGLSIMVVAATLILADYLQKYLRQLAAIPTSSLARGVQSFRALFTRPRVDNQIPLLEHDVEMQAPA